MNILLTNDDGIHARGLEALRGALMENHRVYVIAPDGERSACSNAINVRSPLSLRKAGDGIYSCSGYPADCVNIGLHSGLIPPVDLVLSGINHGPNVGADVYFSGTVAAARTAFIFNVTGIAVSLDDHSGRSPHYADAARFALNFIEREETAGPLFYNINFPDRPLRETAGEMMTFLGRRIYQDSYIITGDAGAECSVRLQGTIDSIEIEGSDITLLERGFITITPLHLDCTDYGLIREMKTKTV